MVVTVLNIIEGLTVTIRKHFNKTYTSDYICYNKH